MPARSHKLKSSSSSSTTSNPHSSHHNTNGKDGGSEVMLWTVVSIVVAALVIAVICWVARSSPSKNRVCAYVTPTGTHSTFPQSAAQQEADTLLPQVAALTHAAAARGTVVLPNHSTPSLPPSPKPPSSNPVIHAHLTPLPPTPNAADAYPGCPPPRRTPHPTHGTPLDPAQWPSDVFGKLAIHRPATTATAAPKPCAACRSCVPHGAPAAGAGTGAPTKTVTVKTGDTLKAYLAMKPTAVVCVVADWCGFCTKLKKETLPHDAVKGYPITTVDVKDLGPLKDHPDFKASGFPLTLVYKDGALKGKFPGYMPPAAFQAKVTKLMSK